MKTLQKVIWGLLLIGLCAGCMHQNRLGELAEKSGNLELAVRNFSQDYQFGDCFLYQEGDEQYMLIVTGVYVGEYTTFMPVAVPAVDSIDEFTVGKFMINYYSREPNMLDALLGGEAQQGGFGFSVFPDDLPLLHQSLRYLFTVNLNPEKVQEYGGTSLIPDQPLGYTIRFCLEFEAMQRHAPGKPTVVKLPLESLCM